MKRIVGKEKWWPKKRVKCHILHKENDPFTDIKKKRKEKKLLVHIYGAPVKDFLISSPNSEGNLSL